MSPSVGRSGPPGRKGRSCVHIACTSGCRIACTSGCRWRAVTAGSWWPATRCRMCRSIPASAIQVRAVCRRPCRTKPGWPRLVTSWSQFVASLSVAVVTTPPRGPTSSRSSASRPAVSRSSVGRSGSMMRTVRSPAKQSSPGSGPTGELRREPSPALLGTGVYGTPARVEALATESRKSAPLPGPLVACQAHHLQALAGRRLRPQTEGQPGNRDR
jgi:hypothetical protein